MTDAGVAFVSAVQYIISVKESVGPILVCAHASTIYAVWSIKSRTEQILPTVLPYWPNIISPNFLKFHERLHYREHNGIAQFYYEHVLQ
jgi:hypothetical protein